MAYISPQRHLHESEDLLPQVTRSIGRNYKRAMSAEFTAGELLTAEYLLPTSHRHLHESEDLPPQVTR
ncbi:hypothetical protein AB4560_18385, partial [Vibrio sp. 10N.222.51.C12]